MASEQPASDAISDEERRVCQEECQARCCRYLTVTLPAPRRKCDYDEIVWFLAHESVSVYFHGNRWHLEVRTPCRYLTEDNLCAVYHHRPETCRQYDLEACEYPARPKHKLQFDTREQFEAWWAKKRERRRRQRRAGRRKARS